MLSKAKELGYVGDSKTEAKNWVLAVDKGLDMSEEARYERARTMGFNTDTVFHHGTPYFFDKFDKSTMGKNYIYAEDSGFFFTKKLRSAEFYANFRAEPKPKGRVISAFLYFNNPIEQSTNSDYYAPADRFDISGHDMMHDARLEGNDSILIKGTRNDDLCIVFDPGQILSVNAAFDPATESYKFDNSLENTLDELIEANPVKKVDLNWAKAENSERPNNFEDTRYVLLQAKVSDIFKGAEDDFTLDINSTDGGKNAIGNRLERAKEHFVSGLPMDYPEVAYSPYKKCISFTNGRHRTLAAFKLGEEFVPMFVFKENLDKFKELVETKPMNEIKELKVKKSRSLRY